MSPWKLGPVFDAMATHRANERLREGVKAYVWLYYRDYTDATAIEPYVLTRWEGLLDSAYVDVDLVDVVREAEAEINAVGGVISDTHGTAHLVCSFPGESDD